MLGSRHLALNALRCTKCEKTKPLDCFYPDRNPANPRARQYWCKTCFRAWRAEYSHGPRFAAWLKTYLARPEVQAARRERDRAQACRDRARKRIRAYRQTPLGKLMHCLSTTRCRFKQAKTDARRERLAQLIGFYQAEIDRIRSQLAGAPTRDPDKRGRSRMDRGTPAH